METPRKLNPSQTDGRQSDAGCIEAVPFSPGGVIMPHVVSPEFTGGDVTTPPIVLPDKLEQSLAREERAANLERRFQEKIEERYAKALAGVKNRRISVSQIQRLLGIGYNHACQIHDMLSARGAIDTGIAP